MNIQKSSAFRQGNIIVAAFLKDRYEAAELFLNEKTDSYLRLKDLFAPLTATVPKISAGIVVALPENVLILDVLDSPGGFIIEVIYFFELLSSRLLRPIWKVIRSTLLVRAMTESTNVIFLKPPQRATKYSVLISEPFFELSWQPLHSFCRRVLYPHYKTVLQRADGDSRKH